MYLAEYLPFFGIDNELLKEIYSDDCSYFYYKYDWLYFDPFVESGKFDCQYDPDIQSNRVFMNENSSNYYSVEEMVNLFVAKDECFMFYNVRSVSHNFDDFFFDCLYDKDSLDVIGLCETCIGEDNNLLGDCQLNNFQFFSVPRNCRGVG